MLRRFIRPLYKFIEMMLPYPFFFSPFLIDRHRPLYLQIFFEKDVTADAQRFRFQQGYG